MPCIACFTAKVLPKVFGMLRICPKSDQRPKGVRAGLGYVLDGISMRLLDSSYYEAKLFAGGG